jgi:TM2 domain-containing membrane protein YozV
MVRAALDDGRLQLSELDDRLGLVFVAQTHGQLAAVIDDLVARRPPAAPPVPMAPTGGVLVPAVSDRKILPAFLLCFFLGMFGIHRFYAGKSGSGLAMLLLTLSMVGAIVTGIWVLVDLIVLAVGSFRDGRGLPLRFWT